MDVQTSCIEFVSSLHGKQRRLERNLSKRDLQTALKYGKRERSYLERWKITWENVVYIVDSTLTHEVTSYSLPLPLLKAPVDQRMIAQASEAKARITDGVRPCTSHTVLIVDQSASMRTADVAGHPSRSRSVFFAIANELIAPQLINCHTSLTDVITLIEMRDVGTLVMHQEPISWVLYNNFVALAEKHKRETCYSHGNFLPSLNLARSVLQRSARENQRCAHALFFLSDGKESDNSTKGFDARPHILDHVANICKSVPKNGGFNFGLFGYSNNSSDFALLQEMTSTAASCGGSAFFSTGLSSGALRSSMSTLMTSLNTSRTALTSIRPPPSLSLGGAGSEQNEKLSLSRSAKRRRKDVCAPRGTCVGPTRAEQAMAPRTEQEQIDSENIPNAEDWDFYYFQGTQNLNTMGARRDKLIRVAHQRRGKWCSVPMRSKSAEGIAIQKKRFGEGAERFVYRLFEVDAAGNAVGEALVAKESAFEETDGESQLQFHSKFEKTQRTAARLAKKFNQFIRQRGLHTCTPQVHFLPCVVYELEIHNPDGSTHLWGVLAEKRLNHKRYVKWNDNRGGVNNRNIEVGLKKEDTGACGGVEAREERCAEERRRTVRFEVEDDGEDGEVEQDRPIEPLQQGKNVLDEDVPQAFSHWTWVYTQHDFLVCDIQGVMSRSFELTDPVIHSTVGQKCLYGKTDHGHAGMRKFLETHNCNPLCKELGIYRK